MITDASVQMSMAARTRYRNVFRQTDPAFRRNWADSISRQEWTDEIKKLDRLNVPLAVVYGEKENFGFVDYLKKTGLKLWHEQILLIPGAGHLVQDDHPEALAALINEFAAECFKV